MIDKITIMTREKKIYFTDDGVDKVTPFRDKIQAIAFASIMARINLSDYKEIAENHAIIASGLSGDWMGIAAFCDYHRTSRMTTNSWIKRYNLPKKVIAGHVVIDNQNRSPGSMKQSKGAKRFRNNLSQS